MKKRALFVVGIMLVTSFITICSNECIAQQSGGIPLFAGWNELGWYPEYDTTASSLKAAITGCQFISKFDGAAQSFWTYTGNPASDFVVTQGQGLLLHTTTASVLTLPGVADWNWWDNAPNMFSIPTGNIGIGTSTPLAKLHVDTGAVLFSGTTGGTPVSGEGTRLMWIPAKAAFRAGYVFNDRWDNSNIGYYSVAMGHGPLADGDYSTAMGTGTAARGDYSTAMGAGTSANGEHSTAMGTDTVAGGDYSTAMGASITVNGVGSIGIGLNGMSPPWVVSAGHVMSIMGGNVGIGTTNPLYLLDVQGYMQAQGYYTGDIIFQKNGKQLWRMYEDENGLYAQNLITGKTYTFAFQDTNTSGPDLTLTINNLQQENQKLQEQNQNLQQQIQSLTQRLDAIEQTLGIQ